MPTLPNHLSRHRHARLAAAVPRLWAVLDSLDAIDRKTPLAPGFAGPRRRLVTEIAALLDKTPLHISRRPMPGELFVAAVDCWVSLHQLFRHLDRRESTANRHAYPRSPEME